MLYEPTNVIPSTLTNSGTIASSDNIEVSWQVNGNSALSKFCIDFFQDDAYSTFVATTGIVNDGCPFFGKNRYGETIPFSYSPLKPWSSLGAAGNNITDGNEYKLKITQFYAANNAIFKFSIGSSTTISQNTNYYFTYTIGSNTTYIGFSVGNDTSLFPTGTDLYYSDTYGVGWVYLPNSPRRLVVLYFGKYTSAPEDYLPLGAASSVTDASDPFYGQAFIQSNTFSAFITRTLPTVDIVLTDQNGTSLTSDTLTTAALYATGNYAQAQGDAIAWIRWQLNSTDNFNPPIEEDTGEVNTPVTTYEYNGLFNGSVVNGENVPREYTLTCTIETINGVQVTAQKEFNVFYEQNSYEGTFNATCLCDEDCNLLAWEPVEVIPGTANPSGGYLIQDEKLVLQEKATITWDEKYNSSDEAQPMNIATPWSAAWRGKIGETTSQFISTLPGMGITLPYVTLRATINVEPATVNVADNIIVSPDGKFLIACTHSSCSLFSINGEELNLLQTISDSENGLHVACFYPKWNYFALPKGNGANSQILIYQIKNNSAVLIETISVSDNLYNDYAQVCAFNPSGTLFVAGTFEHGAHSFSVAATEESFDVEYIGEIKNNQSTRILTSIVSISFNPTGDLLVLTAQNDGGSTTERAAICSVNETDISFSQYLTNNGENFDGSVFASAFSPSGETLLLGGNFSGNNITYNVSNGSMVYKGRIGNGSFSFATSMNAFAFIPDEDVLAAVVTVNGDDVVCFFMMSKGEYFFYKNENTITSSHEPPRIDISATKNKIFYFIANNTNYTIGSEDVFISNFVVNKSNGFNVFVNQDKTLLAIVGDFVGVNSIFSINENNSFSYLGDLLDENGNTFSNPLNIAFVEDDVIVGGNSVNYTNVFLIENGNFISYQSKLTSFVGEELNASSIVYSPYKKSLVVAVPQYSCCYSFNTVNKQFSFDGNLSSNNVGTITGIDALYCSPDGKTLIARKSNTAVYAFTFTSTTTALPTYITSDLETTFSNPPDQSTWYAPLCNFVFNEQGTTLLAILYSQRKKINSGNIQSWEYFKAYMYKIGDDGVQFWKSLIDDFMYFGDEPESDVSLYTEIPKAAAFDPSGEYLFLAINKVNQPSPGSTSLTNNFFEIRLYIISENNIVPMQTLEQPLWESNSSSDQTIIDSTVLSNIYFVSDSSFLLLSSYGTESDNATLSQTDIEIGSIEMTQSPNVLFSCNENGFVIQKNGGVITLSNGSATICEVEISAVAQQSPYVIISEPSEIIVKLTPLGLTVYSFFDGYASVSSNSYVFQSNFIQPNITSVQLEGYQICDYFLVVDGNGDSIPFDESAYYPSWNNDEGYNVELYANFISGIDGGTGTSFGNGFRIYRSEASSGDYKEIATLPSSVTSMKDYGIKSRKEYTYYLYVYDSNGAFMGVKQSNPVTHILPHFSVAVTQYNQEDGAYHVLKEYRFACNIENMTISNNNNPSLSVNFTRYPTRYGITSNYASGTLQSLLGNVDKRYNKYYDTVELMDELNELSTSQYTLFLKDMKGHLYMISTSGAIQQTPTQKTREMQVSISVPWVEIGNAEYTPVLQLPTDEGWDSDEELLNVTLDVDMETGELIATYPYPYNGTSFVLAGENNEILQAQTPIGVTPADFQFSNEAVEVDDGELTATIKTK